MCILKTEDTTMVYLLLMILLFPKGSFATYKVFKNSLTSNDAELYCESLGGSLLGYGTDLLEAVQHCGVSQVLTSRPWYQNYACFHYFQPQLTKAFPNNHLANCASFCSEDQYVFLAVQSTQCNCYTSLVGASPAGNCDATPCPGNSKELCGTTHMTLYRKVTTFQNSKCEYVTVNGNEIEMGTTDCNTQRNFVCQVGMSSEIECYDEKGKTEPPVERTTQAQNLVAESGSSTGIIVGVVLAVLAVIAIVVVVLFLIRRKRRKETDDKQRMDSQSPGTKRQNSNFINAYNDPINYHNVRMASPEPVPIVAFGGDGVDLDSEPVLAPVYTAVHKKPTKTPSVQKQEPAYDEVYKPSNSTYAHVNKNGNREQGRDECSTSFGSYAGLKREQQITPDKNKQNDLQQNKINRLSKKQQIGNSDDELY